MGDSSHLFDDSLMGGDLTTQLDVKEHMQTKEQNAREERSFQNTVKIINRASNVKTKSYDQELRALRKNMFDLHATTPSLHSVALLREGSKIFSMSRIIDHSHKASRTKKSCGTLYGNAYTNGERKNHTVAPRTVNLPPLNTNTNNNLDGEGLRKRSTSITDVSKDNIKKTKGKKQRPCLSPVGSDDVPRDDLIYYDKEVIGTSKLLKKNTKIHLTKALWITNNLHLLYKKRYNLYVKLPPLKQNSFSNSTRQPLVYKNKSFTQNGGELVQLDNGTEKKIISGEQNVENGTNSEERSLETVPVSDESITLVEKNNDVDSLETIKEGKHGIREQSTASESKSQNKSTDKNTRKTSTYKKSNICSDLNAESVSNNGGQSNMDETQKKTGTANDTVDTSIQPNKVPKNHYTPPGRKENDMNDDYLVASEDESNDGENNQTENVSALLTMSLK